MTRRTASHPPGTTDTVVDLGGYPTRVVDQRGAGPAVVLVHGTPQDLGFWDPVVACLGRRRSVRYDLRGHGSAAAVPVAPMDTLVEDLSALIRRLELDDVHLVGHSWGGEVVLRALCDHPEQVRRASLLCTRAAPFPAFAALAAAVRAGTVDPEASLPRWFSPRELADDTVAVRETRARLRRVRRDNWATAIEQIAAFDVVDRLAGITVPVDVVAAEHDGVSAPDHMAEIAATLPRATWYLLEGARHLAPVQRPDDMARILA